MECAAVDRVGEDQAQPVRIGAGDRAICDGYIGLHGARQMHQVHPTAGNFRRGGARRGQGHGGFPRTKSPFHLFEDFVAIEVADDQEQRFRGDVIGAIKLRERIARVGFHLLFGGSDRAVGMRAE